MKKTKLALSKQTITQLTTTSLTNVAGGGPHAQTRADCASDGCTVGCATQGNCGNSVHGCIATRASC